MKTKTVIGAVVLAAAVLLSVPLGASRSFSRLRDDVYSEYVYDDTGYGIFRGVDARRETAQNVLTLAARYKDQDPEVTSLINDLDYAIKLAENYWFDDIQDVGQEIGCDQQLGEAAHKLCEKLETLELSEKDKKYPRQLMTDLDSELDKMQRSSFNDEVAAYNEKVDKYPLQFLLNMIGVKPIASFQDPPSA